MRLDSFMTRDDRTRMILPATLDASTASALAARQERLQAEAHVVLAHLDLPGNLGRLGPFQIEHEAALVAVEGLECGRVEGAVVMAERIAAVGTFDLDHLGAQVRENQAAGRSHDDVAELDHAQALERQSGPRIEGHRRRLDRSRIRPP